MRVLGCPPAVSATTCSPRWRPGPLASSSVPLRRDDFLAAVLSVSDGDAVFTPGLAGLVLGQLRRLAEDPVGEDNLDVPHLTPREYEILRMVAKCRSYRQIAEELTLSHRTVQNHVQNTLRKLQLHNRVELVRYAIEQGLDEGGLGRR